MDIYLLAHRGNGRKYVGATIRSVGRRISDHKKAAFKEGRVQPLYHAIREFGMNAFDVTVLETTDSYEKLMDLERQHIIAQNSLYPAGFNLVQGGRGNYGWKMSAATKAKISAKAMGRTAWNKGVPMSTERVAQMSAERKGKPKTQAQADSFAKMQQACKHPSESTRAIWRAQRRGKGVVPCVPIEFMGKRYESIQEAIRESGFSKMQVYYRLSLGRDARRLDEQAVAS